VLKPLAANMKNGMYLDKNNIRFVFEDSEREWLDNHIEFVEKYQKPFIEIDKLYDNEEFLITGDSKIGGKPDLPIDFDWPEYKGEAMVFLCQINCKEICFFNEDLPNYGWLYFFLYVEKAGQIKNYIDSKEKFKILYFEGDEKELEEYYWPNNLQEKYRFKSNGLKFTKKWMLPDYESITVKQNEPASQDFFILREIRDYCKTTNCKMFGYPNPIQDDVLYDWSSQYFEDYELKDRKKTNQYAEENCDELICILEFDTCRKMIVENVFAEYEVLEIPNGYWGDIKKGFGKSKF